MRSNQVEDKVKVIKASVLNDIEDAFDYIFANIPILEEVWSSKGMEMKTVTKDLLQAATSKLNAKGKIYIPWCSFAENERNVLESMIAEQGYEYALESKQHLGYTWYLYVLSKKEE